MEGAKCAWVSAASFLLMYGSMNWCPFATAGDVQSTSQKSYSLDWSDQARCTLDINSGIYAEITLISATRFPYDPKSQFHGEPGKDYWEITYSVHWEHGRPKYDPTVQFLLEVRYQPEGAEVVTITQQVDVISFNANGWATIYAGKETMTEGVQLNHLDDDGMQIRTHDHGTSLTSPHFRIARHSAVTQGC